MEYRISELGNNNENTLAEGVINMLKTTFEQSRLTSWIWDFKSKQLCWIDEDFQHRSDTTEREQLLLHETLFGKILPEDLPKVQNYLDKLSEQPQASFDFRNTFNGNLYLKQAVFHLERDEYGSPSCIKGTLQNVTELQLETVYLRQLNAAFQQSEKLANLGNWQFNLATKKYLYSGNLFEIFGVEARSFEPGFDSFRKFVHPDDTSKLLTNHDLLNHPDEPILREFRIINPGGEIVHIKSISKIISNYYGEQIVLGTIQDVTNEVILRRHLEEKALLNQLIFDNSIDYVFACDQQLKITAWNRKCEEKYLLSKEDVIGKQVREVFTNPEGQLLTIDLKLALKGKEVHKEGKSEHEDAWYDRYTMPLKNAGGNIFGALCIFHDLTAIKNVTNKLVELNYSLKNKNDMLEQSNNELASFSYVASHDLQEPLRKIQTFSSRILEKEYSVLSDQGIEYFKRMEASARRMQVLIDDLLTFSKTNTQQKDFQNIDLNKLIAEVQNEIGDLIEEKHGIIQSDPLPVARVIAFQFRQLIENLLLNSLKYNKPGAAPHIQILYKKVTIDEPMTDEGLPAGVYHRISVKDNGIGFEQEYKRKIFELFQRLHGKSEYPGTGLGLSICKRIVQNHDGAIVAEGGPGQGATFTFFLPA